MKTVSLSDRTYRLLLSRAESFEDTAETVIDRLLSASGSGRNGSTTHGGRASPGSILPEREYWPAILTTLEERGGSAHATDVIEAVGERLRDRLQDRDHEELQLGEVRWRNRVRFARLRLRERGLLSAASPRGVWEITDEGRRYLAKHAADSRHAGHLESG